MFNFSADAAHSRKGKGKGKNGKGLLGIENLTAVDEGKHYGMGAHRDGLKPFIFKPKDGGDPFRVVCAVPWFAAESPGDVHRETPRKYTDIISPKGSWPELIRYPKYDTEDLVMLERKQDSDNFCFTASDFLTYVKEKREEPGTQKHIEFTVDFVISNWVREGNFTTEQTAKANEVQQQVVEWPEKQAQREAIRAENAKRRAEVAKNRVLLQERALKKAKSEGKGKS